MLLFLHESLEDYIDDREKEREEVVVALENIATGRYLGKHLVLGSRSTLKALAQWNELGNVARTTYRKVYNDLTQSGQLAAKFSYRVDVVANHFGVLCSSKLARQTKIQVPITHFRNNSLTQETMLLSENFRDTAVYEQMARFCARTLGFNSVHLSMYAFGGGGADTAEHYKRCQDSRNRFCICIVDSDRKSPDDSLKKTAQAVRAVDDEEQPMCMYVYTSGHELENYIPTSWYKAVTEDESKFATIEFLERLENSEFREARRFLDIKNGLHLKQAFEEMRRSSARLHADPYWRNLVAALSELSNGVDTECLKREACREPNDCGCCVMVGLGRNVIDKIIDYLNRTSWRRMEKGLCSATRSEWETVGSLILAWCCGATAMFGL